MLREVNLIRAPTLVTSHTSHSNTPRLEPKNNSTPVETAVLPVERLSISAVIRVLDKSLVSPTAAVVAPPNPSIHEPASNRAPGNDDRPKMPNLCPCRLRATRSFKILTVSNHLVSPARGRRLARGSAAASHRTTEIRGITLLGFIDGATRSAR